MLLIPDTTASQSTACVQERRNAPFTVDAPIFYLCLRPLLGKKGAGKRCEEKNGRRNSL
jgi:hypothetical protein